MKLPDTHLVSIVIPVYNSEKYLDRCLESVLSQTYTNIEIVLIDDGSTDGSRAICAKYAEADNRIVLLEQPNQGVSAARNKAIEEASGEYVTFVDSDDYLDLNAIETMSRLVNKFNADIVRTRWREIKNGKMKIGTEQVDSGIYPKSELNELLYKAATHRLQSFSWLLIVRKELLLSNGIRFPQGVSMMEDTCFYIDVLAVAKSVYISDEVTYNYLLHSESASRSIDGFSDKVESIIKVSSYLAEKDFSATQLRCINAIHVSIIANMLMARIKNVLDTKGMSSMLSIIHSNESVQTLYKQSNPNSLDLYHRVETWSIMNRSKPAIQILKLARKIVNR